MHKQAGIGDFDLSKIPKTWMKATGSPLGSAITLGAAAAVPTYFLAPWALKKAYGAMRPYLPADTQAEMEEEIATKMPAMKWKATAVAAALAGGLSLAHNWNPKYPMTSLTDWNYGVPKAASDLQYMQGGFGESVRMGQHSVQPGDPALFRKPWSVSAEMANLNPAMLLETIPLEHSRELVFRDPFMNDRQKGQAGAIFNNTGYNTETGNTSIAGLAGGAMRAGFGLAGGVLAGHVMGKLFSLPNPVTRALSIAGGIAGTLINTGVVK